MVGVVRPIVAKLFISDIEFLISLKSRFNACAFISDVDDVTWCNRCDEEVLATRDVVVLLVDDELLLFTTYWLNK